jgi:hypothetical protein
MRTRGCPLRAGMERTYSLHGIHSSVANSWAAPSNGEGTVCETSSERYPTANDCTPRTGKPGA